jgi:hypothetical protein
MKRNFGSYLVMMAGVLALLWMASAPANAQEKGDQKKGELAAPGYAKREASKPLPDGGPAPRTADGHPDLSGHWYVGVLGKEDATLLGSFGAEDPNVLPFDPKTTHEDKPSFQPWVIEKMKAEGNFKILDDTRDPSSFSKMSKADQVAAIDVELIHLQRNCMPGVRGMGIHGAQFIQGRDFLAQVTETNHDYRLIPIDGRPHTQNPDPSFNGESRGHWEGDTLVVDTVGVDERVWNNDQWRIHSDQEHIIERFTRLSMNYLTYQVTIEDPKVLTKPWTSAPHRYSLSHEEMLEWYCPAEIHPADDEEMQALRKTRERLLQEIQQEKQGK